MKKGSDLAMIHQNGDTTLHLAVCSRRLKVIDLILRHRRAYVNRIDIDDNTPLRWPAFPSYDKFTERLLAADRVLVNLIGGFGWVDILSALFHHSVIRSDTMILK